MKMTIKTPNSKMAFNLRPEAVESLVWSAYQYSVETQPPQDELEMAAQPVERYEGYADGTESLAGEEMTIEMQPQKAAGECQQLEGPTMDRMQQEADGWKQTGSDGTEPDGANRQGVSDGMPPGLAQESQTLEPSCQWKMQEPKHQKYKGFMLIKCKHCGKLKGMCAKTPIDTYTCSCGGKTPIQDMVPVVAKCECGKNWLYRTNADDQMLEINCLECGSPIDLEWNSHKGIYDTLQN